ncbi:MAG: hypothetical protein VCF24_16070 [Candidatus Latescibacterota bacterium]
MMNEILPEPLPKDVEELAAKLSHLKSERNRGKDLPVMMTVSRALSLLVLFGLVVVQSRCASPTTFKFADSAGLSNPPTEKIPLRIEVIDLTDTTGINDSFRKQMRFHDLSPDLPQRIQNVLSKAEFRYVAKNGYKYRINNPFVVDTGSSDALLSLRVAVMSAGYAKGQQVARHKLALLDILSIHPQAFLEVVCQLRKPPEARVLYEFDAFAISAASGQRGRALNEAVDMAVDMIVKKLVEPTTGY